MAARIFEGKLVNFFPFSECLALRPVTQAILRDYGINKPQQITNAKVLTYKNSRNLSYLCSKHVYWHTCLIAIQFRSSRLNDYTLFNLYQVGVLFVSND